MDDLSPKKIIRFDYGFKLYLSNDLESKICQVVKSFLFFDNVIKDDFISLCIVFFFFFAFRF